MAGRPRSTPTDDIARTISRVAILFAATRYVVMKADKWDCFDWPEILREAKARLEEARRIGNNIEEKDTLEYWCAWCAHANAAAVFHS